MRFFLSLALMLYAAGARAFGQEGTSNSAPLALAGSTEPPSLDTQGPQESHQPDRSGSSGAPTNPKQAATEPGDRGTPPPNQQPKRILGIMPNFRAVSAGALPPPPTPKQAFIIATQNSFDYSSFIFVGITSLFG